MTANVQSLNELGRKALSPACVAGSLEKATFESVWIFVEDGLPRSTEQFRPEWQPATTTDSGP
jgi:hypothetical protein